MNYSKELRRAAVAREAAIAKARIDYRRRADQAAADLQREAQAGREAGLTWAELANKLGCNVVTVCMHADDERLERYRARQRANHQARQADPAQAERMRAYQRERWKAKKLAAASNGSHPVGVSSDEHSI